MKISRLKLTLRTLVQEHGMGKVLKSLGEIAARDNGAVKAVRQIKGRKPRLTAPEYVGKMKLPLDKADAVVELAQRFEEKEFLPNFKAVAEFCRTYHLEVPASKSRVSAIPRVFKFIAKMEDEEVESLLENGMFAGPSRLGPIADAIRNFNRTPTPTHSE